MRRLYFRIYLAVLGSLALFAVLVGLSGWLFHELREPDAAGQQPPFMQDVAEHLLQAGASPEALGQELQFWHNTDEIRSGAAFARGRGHRAGWLDPGRCACPVCRLRRNQRRALAPAWRIRDPVRRRAAA